MQRRATPDAPEHIDHRRRCTRHDHRTVVTRIARERVPTRATRCENASIAVPREPPQDFFTCPSVHEKLSANAERRTPNAERDERLNVLTPKCPPAQFANLGSGSGTRFGGLFPE